MSTHDDHFSHRRFEPLEPSCSARVLDRARGRCSGSQPLRAKRSRPRRSRPGPLLAGEPESLAALEERLRGEAQGPPRLLFLGGNGHADARLDAARAALAALDADERFELHALRYPGFEGRARAASFEEFLDRTERELELADPCGRGVVYGTGIGALIALALRARGSSTQRRLLIQGGVLWGLEERLFPKLMRGPLPHLLHFAFRARPIQARFMRKHFERVPSDAERAAFFRGYAQCHAFPDLFRWLTPALLRSLERSFAARPAALRGVEIWWGARDRVVGLSELELTQRALDTNWPTRVYPDWGHYPMLDAPEEWVRALSDALATSTRG